MYVEPENASDIVAKLRYYKEHPDIARQHGEDGYKFACEHFDRHKLAAKYIELFKGLKVHNCKDRV